MSTWGLYPWFRESGLDLIHPDDLAIVLAHSPYGVVCEVVGKDGPYLVIRFGDRQFRGMPALFQAVSAPIFRIGQSVATKAPRTLRTGFVRKIGWHSKNNAPVYFLEANGRPQKSRYEADELEAVDAVQET